MSVGVKSGKTKAVCLMAGGSFYVFL